MAEERAPLSAPGGRRLASAGRILGVGLLCFVSWLVFDARQLYTSAIASPLGVRRSVAIAVLRPIVRVSKELDLDRPVSGADDALGRKGTPGGSVAVASGQPGSGTVPGHGSTPGPRSAPGRDHGSRPRHGSAPKPRSTTTTSTSTTVPRVPPAKVRLGPPRIVQPSAAHPITMLVVGDSIGADLGFGLGDILSGDPSVRIVQDAVGSTGLAALAYYDWPAQLEVELRKYRPKIVLVMLGGNDAQNFDVGTRFAGFGDAYWHTVYSERVSDMMNEATGAGAHVLWVGMPLMASSATLSSADMSQVDAVYQAQARVHPGVEYMSTMKLLSNAAGQYAEYLPNASGTLIQVRDSDGIHIAEPGGSDLLAGAAVHLMDQEWHVKL